MNKSASLTAGVCTLCVTATMVAVPPHAAAAELPVVPHRSVSVLDQPYELTAASAALQNLLLVAGIPFNNLSTTLSTLGGLTNFVTGLNQALGNIYKGNWDLVPANLQKAWTDEVAAFQKVLQLPQTLIAYNTKTIQNFINSVGAGGSTLTGPSAASTAAALPTAQSDVTNALLVVLGIPFNNLNTTLSTLGGLTNFVTGLNQALGNIYKGNWNLVPANLQKAWTDEVAAFQKVLQLPQTLIAYNVQALQNLFGNLGPASVTSTFVSSERVYSLALPSAAAPLGIEAPTTAEELADKESEDSTGTADSQIGTEAEDGIETAVESEVVDTVEEVTPDEVVPAVPADEPVVIPEETAAEENLAPADADDSSVTPAEEAAGKPEVKDADKPGDTETDAADDSDDAATYGKHARQDDSSDSAASASAGGSAESSAPGRHRKADGDAKDSASASSDTSSAAA